MSFIPYDSYYEYLNGASPDPKLVMKGPFSEGNLIAIKSIYNNSLLTACTSLCSSGAAGRIKGIKDPRAQFITDTINLSAMPAAVWKVRDLGGKFGLQTPTFGNKYLATGAIGSTQYAFVYVSPAKSNLSALAAEFSPVHLGDVGSGATKKSYWAIKNVKLGTYLTLLSGPESPGIYTPAGSAKSGGLLAYMPPFMPPEEWSSNTKVEGPARMQIFEIIEIDRPSCCMSQATLGTSKLTCFDYWDNPTTCDKYMEQICSIKENKDQQICSCINSPLLKAGMGGKYNPACIDPNCMTFGYKLNEQRPEHRGACPDIVDCSAQIKMGKAGINVKNLTGVKIEQDCGQQETPASPSGPPPTDGKPAADKKSPPPNGKKKGTVVLVVGIIVAVVILLLLLLLVLFL